jgi:hypothetical protein
VRAVSDVLLFCHHQLLSENAAMKEMVTLSKKEHSRLMVLNGIEIGGMTGMKAAEVLAVSLRYVKRILAAYSKEGAAALAHGNKSRNQSSF